MDNLIHYTLYKRYDRKKHTSIISNLHPIRNIIPIKRLSKITFHSTHTEYRFIQLLQRRFNYPTTNDLSAASRPTGRPLSTAMPPSTAETDGADEGQDICSGGFDALTAISGELFIFRGRRVWRLDAELRIMAGYPMLVTSLFSGFYGQRINAAYQRDTDGAVVLFSDSEFWVFLDNSFDLYSPRPISDFGIPSSVTKVDAAFVWTKNYKTYLFSGNQFWRYDDVFQRMDEGYPKNISRWHGIPKDLDAVATFPNGQTLFVKNNSYWVYNNYWIRPEIGYPKSISNLFQCSA